MSAPDEPTPRLSRAEIAKDVVQTGVGSAATTVGRVTGILTGAVREVADAIGDFATDMFELRDAARKAAQDREEALGGPDGPAAVRPAAVEDHDG